MSIEFHKHLSQQETCRKTVTQETIYSSSSFNKYLRL